MNNNFKSEFIKIKDKDKLNDIAIQKAVREQESIKYDTKFPLTVNEETKILEIKKIEDEDISDTMFNKVKIHFEALPEEKNGYVKELTTTLSLNELEEKLQCCENEDDIDLLQE